MRLAVDTITVFNARYDITTDLDVYRPTVLRHCSWFSVIESNVDHNGLTAANRITVRIPQQAIVLSGKRYLSPEAYALAGTSGDFTLANGDIIVKGDFSALTDPRPSTIQAAAGGDMMTILAVSDDRRAPNAPHFKVVGK